MLLAHGRDDGDEQVLALVEVVVDLLAELTLGEAHIVLGGAVLGHEVEKPIIDVHLRKKGSALAPPARDDASTHELELGTEDVGDIHVVGGRAEIFDLLAGEDVDGDKMNLGVTVLASLGGGHFDDLAGTVLDHDEAVLAESRALHRVGGRGTGVGALEGVLML